MTHIPGLDKWLTTPPEDREDLSYDFYAEEVESAMGGEWQSWYEPIVRKCYDNCIGVYRCADRLREEAVERQIEKEEYND